MKQLTLALYLSLWGILAIAPALPASASSGMEALPYRIQYDDSARIVPFDVNFEWREDGLVITGRIKKRWSYHGRIVGHVDVRLLNGRDEMLHEHKVLIYGRSPTHKNPDRAKFSITLSSIPAEVSTIHIRHHSGA